MLTLTRQGLLLSLSATVIPSQGSSDVPVAVVNDINTYVGYTLEPRVGYYLNGIYKSTVCTYDTSAKTFSVPAEAFKQIGIIDITLALIDNANANHIETCQTVHATVNKAPLGTVVLPDQTTWQDYVNSYMNQLFDSNYKPQFDQIQQDLENLVTEAQQQQQTAEQQQTQIDNAISVMGEYQIVSNDPVQIQFKQGDGTFGPTVDLGDGLASKSMVNAGYYQSIGSQYSGAASDYGIQVEEIVGAYSQGSNPSPDNPQEMQAVEISELHSSGKNLFDADSITQVGRTYAFDISKLVIGETYTISCDADSFSFKISNTIHGNTSAGAQNVTTGKSTFTMARRADIPEGTTQYLFITKSSSITANDITTADEAKALHFQIEKGSTATAYEPYTGADTVTLSEPLILRALPNGVADSYEDGVITRRVGVAEFDGSADEAWTKNTSSDYAYQITLKGMKPANSSNGDDLLCDSFIATTNLTSLTDGRFRRGGAEGLPVLVFRYDGLTTDDLNAWRTWLKSNPITVWYELAEPTTETFEIPRLQSWADYANAWCDSIVQPQITWNVLTGRSAILDGNGDIIQNGYMTPQDNLLRNSDFRYGAINQLGQTQYTNTSYAAQMTADEWYIDYGSVNIYANSVYFENNGSTEYGFKQFLSLPIDTYTFYLDCAINGSARVFARNSENEEVINETVSGTVKQSFTFTNSLSFITIIASAGTKISFNFMKLEKGSVFTGMPPWNYALEYLKCCRYLYVWHLPEIPSHGYNSINNLSYFTGTAFPVPFASTPTFTVKQLLMDQVDVSSDLNTINVTPNRCTSISLTGQISTISGTIIFSNEPS